MKALIDTNIWLDSILKREPFAEYARSAIMICINEDIEMLVAATSVKDIFYIIERVFDEEKAYDAVTTVLTAATIAAVDDLVCNNALNLERPDYEDGIIAAIAQVENADLIISRDSSAFNKLDIPKYSPQEFIEHMGYEEIAF